MDDTLKKYILTPICHTGIKLIFEWNGMKFFGAGYKNDGRKIFLMENVLVIDLDNNINPKVEYFNLSEKSRNLLDQYKLRKVIKLDWRDFSIPNLDRDFWNILINVLKEEKENGIKNVVATCWGGHGRTGTFFAVLVGLLGISTDPIGYIRSTYCTKAIESLTQMQYIQFLTGCDTKTYQYVEEDDWLDDKNWVRIDSNGKEIPEGKRETWVHGLYENRKKNFSKKPKVKKCIFLNQDEREDKYRI